MIFMDYDKKEKIDIDGFISNGVQYDLDAKLMEDNRAAVFGVVRDSYGEPIADAVVKLIEVVKEYGKEDRRPVSHTFTDKDGEFVFGPLCPRKKYEIQIWANKVEHVKFCEICPHHGKCLKGVELDCDKHNEADSEDCSCDIDYEINEIIDDNN
jgi:hypothetical protein